MTVVAGFDLLPAFPHVNVRMYVCMYAYTYIHKNFIYIHTLKLLFSPGPGLGAPLSSYLEVALYKFHR